MNNIHTIFDYSSQELSEEEKALNDALDRACAQLNTVLEQTSGISERTQRIFSESQQANQLLRHSNKELLSAVKITSQMNKQAAQLVNLLKGAACVAISVGCYCFAKSRKM